ncbi:MAG: DUF4079 family protein [Synechococcaceae cyanobacterium]
MTLIDWLWILHPALMVVLAYPLLGGVLLLARRTRQRRLGGSPTIPASSGSEHRDLGRWLTTAVVATVLVALAVVISTHSNGPFPGGFGRLALLGSVALGAAASLAALLRVKQAAYRAVFALLCWVGLLGLGGQPEVWRVSDNPFSAGFWQSHYWGGMGLVGLLLFSLAAQPEIVRHLRWRHWHLLANGLALLLFIAQGISGSRDLLEIPLSWQKPFIYSCDPIQRTCPTPRPPG